MMGEQATREGLRAWRALGVPVDAERATCQREQVVDAIARAMRSGREQRQWRQRRKAIVTGLALAAAAVLGVGGWLVTAPARGRGPAAVAPDAAAVSVVLREVQGTVVADRAGRSEVVSAEGALELNAGDAVSTLSEARARLLLPGSGQISVGSTTDLRIQESRSTAQRLDIGIGHIEVSLPKQTPARSLVVNTPNVEVAVVGTVFAVDVCRPAGDQIPITEVRVTRGVVRVLAKGHRPALVSQGESWSSSGSLVGPAPCIRPTAESASAGAASAEPEAQPAETRGPERVRAGSSRDSSKGELAAQNRLYQEALDARNSRDDGRAVALLGELLTKYPDSPLRQEAQVERLRALKRLGELGEAARSARRYLAEHARGFARDEALELIWGPDPAKTSGAEP
jgi:hypothetical protein